MCKALYSTPSTREAGRIRYGKRKTEKKGRESGEKGETGRKRKAGSREENTD